MIDLDVDNEKPRWIEAAGAAGILLTAVLIAVGAAALASLIWFAYEVLSWIG
jgi:hypothetical protein